MPYEIVVGHGGLEFLIKTHLQVCRALYESTEFWNALESVKYDLFITHLLGSGCDSYIAHKLQVPMIAITTSAMPTWYLHKIYTLLNCCASNYYTLVTAELQTKTYKMY